VNLLEVQKWLGPHLNFEIKSNYLFGILFNLLVISFHCLLLYIAVRMGKFEILALSIESGAKKNFCIFHISNHTSLFFSIQGDIGKDYQSGMTQNEA
jgi:hypothetical protein